MIVQETGTVPGITVAENIFLGETKFFKSFGEKHKWGPVKRKLSAFCIPAIIDVTVDLPEPFSPISPRTLPEQTSIETSFNATVEPNLLFICSTFTKISCFIHMPLLCNHCFCENHFSFVVKSIIIYSSGFPIVCNNQFYLLFLIDIS